MSKLRVLVLGAAFVVLPFAAQAQTAPPQPPPAQPPAKTAPAQAAKPAQQAPPAAAQTPQAPPVPAPAAPSVMLEQIIVKVNGDIVTKTELEARQIDAIRRRGQQLSDAQLKQAIGEMTPDLIVEAIDELLLWQRGNELGYKVTEEQYQSVLDNIRKENKLESEEAFAAALKQEGLDMKALRKNLERGLVVNKVQQVEVTGKLGLSEEEAKRYYDVHKSEFTTPASITLRELFLAVPVDGAKTNAAAEEETQRKATAALARVKAGESFEKLVAELSDLASKANGGLVGPMQPEELAPDIRKLIEPLKPGDVTAVFHTPNGYGFLRLETATKAETKPFEQVRDDVGSKVYEAKRRAEFDKYIRRLRSEGIIEWKNEEMQKLWLLKTSAPLPEPKK